MRGYFNIPYQDDKTYTYPALPVPTLLLNVVSSGEIDLTAAVGVTVFSWTFERAPSASGPWTIIAVQGSPIFANTGLSPSTTYFYRVKAFTNNGYTTSYSSVQSGTTPSQSSAIKWNPGHWAEANTVVSGSGQIAAVQTQIDLMLNLQNVQGMMFIVTWACLQQAINTYTWTNLDTLVNYITNRTTNSAGIAKRWALTVNPGALTSRWPTGSTSIVPAYIQNDVATYGQAGVRTTFWPLSGTIAAGATSGTLSQTWTLPSGTHSCTFPDSNDVRTVTFTNNSTAISWSGGLTGTSNGNLTISPFTYNPPGDGGYWGGDGNGTTYSAAIWRPNVGEEWIKLHEAILARYESDPLFEMVYHIENSFVQGAGNTNADGTYNDTDMSNNAKSWLQRCTIAGPTTNVAYSNTFLKTQTPTSDLTVWMMQTTSPTLAHAVNVGQTDCLGLLTGGSSHTGGANGHSWGAEAYIGFIAPNIDFRSKRLFVTEVQAPDQGFFVDIGAPREDILDAINTTYHATHAFWAVVARPTTAAGAGTVPWPITWTAAPPTGATSATMTTPWRLQSGSYTITFTGGSKTGTFANGSTAVTWSGGVAAGQPVNETVTYPLTPGNWWNGSTGNAGADGLGAFLNDPANALIYTGYPPDYP